MTRVVLVATDGDAVVDTAERLRGLGAEVAVVEVAVPGAGRAPASRAGRALRSVRAGTTALRPAPSHLVAAAQGADVVVATSAECVPVVWRLRRRTRAALVHGVPAAVHLLTSGGGTGPAAG